MCRFSGFLLLLACTCLVSAPAAQSQPTSEGHPHKWEIIQKSMADLIAEGFELKSVAYDSSDTGAKPGEPDVHYFLQKRRELVRCDFRRRDQTSYYWCARLTKPRNR